MNWRDILLIIIAVAAVPAGVAGWLYLKDLYLK